MSEVTYPTKRESTEERRVAIAKAARALIAEKGMEGLRTRDIAERVGINIATLHYHVPHKEALVALVAESMRHQFRAQSLARPREHLPAAEQLEHEFYDFYEMLTGEPDIVCVIGELSERARRDPVVREAIAPMQQRWHDMVSEILRKGRDEGSFRPDIDPTAAAAMIIGALVLFRRSGDLSNDSYQRLCAELRRAVRHPDFIKD
jgi:AcrR family transcriptional regulator